MQCWLQRGDYTATEYGATDVATAIRLLNSHDWLAELAFESERNAAGMETCPPGIGFVADASRILHICPARDGTALVHYHFEESRLRVRTMPLYLRAAVILITATLAMRLLPSGDAGRSLVGAAAGVIALYLLGGLIRRIRDPWSMGFEPVLRTGLRIPWTDLNEVIRRFYAEDHSWLIEHVGRSRNPELLEKRDAV
jgi:hypothetical protein